VTEQWSHHKLSFENLMAQLRATAQKKMEQSPEVVCETFLLKAGGHGLNGASLEARTVARVLEQWNQLIGRPGDDRVPQPLARALDEAAAAVYDASERKLAEIVVCLIDQPSYHLGGAEEAIGCIRHMLQQDIEQQKALYQNLLRQTAEKFERIESLLLELQKCSGWFGRKGKISAELLELLQAYPKLRYQGMLVQRVLTVYQKMFVCTSVHLKEIDEFRDRLTELVKFLQDRSAAAPTRRECSGGQYLLPDGCQSLTEAAQRICEGLAPVDFLDLDQQVQSAIKKKFKSLVNVCTNKTKDMLKDLADLLQQQADLFVKTHLTQVTPGPDQPAPKPPATRAPAGQIGADVAEIYLDQHRTDESIVRDVAGIFNAAVMEFGQFQRVVDEEICFVAAPSGPAGDHFRRLTQKALPGVEVVSAPSTDEIVLLREQPNLPLAELPQLGSAGCDAYEKMTAIENFTPHSRTDIFEWTPIPMTG
jgi:hypothetical protein